MELQINLFQSASSAASDAAKKLGLISAGFGRYRSDPYGPVTHTTVKGKLVAAADQVPVASNPKAQVYLLDRVEYFDLDNFSKKAVVADLLEANKTLGTKVFATDFNSKYQTVSLVGTRADIVRMCRKGRIFVEVDEFLPEEFDMELRRYDPKKFAALEELYSGNRPKKNSAPKKAKPDLKSLESDLAKYEKYSDNDVDVQAYSPDDKTVVLSWTLTFRRDTRAGAMRHYASKLRKMNSLMDSVAAEYGKAGFKAKVTKPSAGGDEYSEYEQSFGGSAEFTL